MDYSLLVGIHCKSRKATRGFRRASVFVRAGDATTGPPMLIGGGDAAARNAVIDVDDVDMAWRPPGTAVPLAVGVGVGDEVRPPRSDGGGIQGVEVDGTPSDEVYFLGLIDNLQQFDLKKRGEFVLKSMIHNSAEISSVNPTLYRSRFVQFITDHTS